MYVSFDDFNTGLQKHGVAHVVSAAHSGRDGWRVATRPRPMLYATIR